MVSKHILIWRTRSTFGSTVRILKTRILSSSTGGLYATHSTVAKSYIYIYRERERERDRLMCFRMYMGWNTHGPNLKFENSNGRSEPFILFSILICAWRPNFIFFWIFLLFIKYFTKLLIQRWLHKTVKSAATVGSTIL